MMKPLSVSLACLGLALVMWAVSPSVAAQGQIVGWGQFVVNSDWGSGTYVEVAAGTFHTVARRSDGSVVAWGHNGYGQCDVPSLAFYADRYVLSLNQGGTQKFTLNAGTAHAGRLYWIFGSATGTSPGVTLNGVHIPLNPDHYTDLTIGLPWLNPPFQAFRGSLDSAGNASAAFALPWWLPSLPDCTLYHAYVVYDAQGTWHMASNAVPLRLVN